MIRKMKDEDVDQAVYIDEKCLHGRWHRRQFLYELHENPYANLYVVEEQDIVIGFLDYWITFENAQLANIAILPDYQGKGYGRALMNTMFHACEEAMCENITLEVRTSNHKAQQMYHAHGFIDINIKKGYYNDNGEDAVYMMKPLGGSWV